MCALVHDFFMERIITIQGLSARAFIGVPSEEREQAQQLCFDLRFAALLQPETLNDDIATTVDYAALSQRLEQIVQERPRKLIETMADEITAILLAEFSLRWIELTLRKFILPNAEHVAVTVRREAGSH
jgi:dihydroneopterin aldolase